MPDKGVGIQDKFPCMYLTLVVSIMWKGVEGKKTHSDVTPERGTQFAPLWTSSQDIALRRSKIAISSVCNPSHIYHDPLKYQTRRHSKYP